jgi:hypothetical protein
MSSTNNTAILILVAATTTTTLILAITGYYIYTTRKKKTITTTTTTINNRVQLFISAIDDINKQDPRLDENGQPTELIYSQRMSSMLLKLNPQANDLLQMACHAQHVGRWKIPRSLFPEGKAGYLQWRKKCQFMHSDIALQVIREQCPPGMFTEPEQEELKHMLCKEDLKNDPLVQTTEDVAALVFLQWSFKSFYQKHINEEEKIIDIVKKTWNKMSDQGKKVAINEIVPGLEEELKNIVGKAVT